MIELLSFAQLSRIFDFIFTKESVLNQDQDL